MHRIIFFTLEDSNICVVGISGEEQFYEFTPPPLKNVRGKCPPLANHSTITSMIVLVFDLYGKPSKRV